jgi:hypothetical protein
MMKKILAVAAFAFCTLALAAPSQAQHTRGSAPAVHTGTAVPRGGAVAPGHPVAGHPGGGYYYGGHYHYAGYPYYYAPYYYPYGYYGYPGWGFSVGFGYGYPGYPYYGAAYYGGGSPSPYGGVQIKDAPKDAQVYADGYYAGIVEDFDGALQHLSLQPGAHHIEIRAQGQQPISVDVNVVPGETITYHAR